jgi:flagellar basal body rod protein FlgC
VVARCVLTGTEVVYESAAAAAASDVLRTVNVTAKLLGQTYIDKKRQAGGFTWRSEGRPHWVPMSGFVFSPLVRNTGVSGYVVARTNTETRVFESIHVAAALMQLDERRLANTVRGASTHNGIAWSRLEHADAGRWSDAPPSPSTEAEDDPYVPPTNAAEGAQLLQASGANARCYGKLIARNLASGEETVYDSANRLASVLTISPHALRDTYIDQPRQVQGLHVRSIDATRRWQPPASLVYDPTTYERSKRGYVVCTLPNGVVEMYESQGAAKRLLAVEKVWQLEGRIDTGRPCDDGRLWRHAIATEFNEPFYIDCKP